MASKAIASGREAGSGGVGVAVQLALRVEEPVVALGVCAGVVVQQVSDVPRFEVFPLQRADDAGPGVYPVRDAQADGKDGLVVAAGTLQGL